MKGPSEGRIGSLLRATGCFAYKPPDDARNWKPCDFMVWVRDMRPKSFWVEVKSSPSPSLPARDLRPSQLAGVAEAMRLGISYWLVVSWTGWGDWTAVELTALQQGTDAWVKTLPHDWHGWTYTGRASEVIFSIVEQETGHAGRRVADGVAHGQVRQGQG